MDNIRLFFKNHHRNKKNERRQNNYERHNDILYKRHAGEKVLYVIMFIIFLLFAISYIFPFVWVLLNALKTSSDFAKDFTSLPKELHFENFATAINYKSRETRDFTIFQMLGMSLLVSGLGTFATVFISSCASYVVAKYEFPGRKIIMGVVIFTMIIPIVGALPSQIQLMETLHLDGKVIGLVFLYSGGFGGNFLLLYSFFKNLSWTYVEAAKIDGASDFRIFNSIILPMAKGPIVAISTITFIGLWNDYMTPMIYLPEKPTIAVGLRYLFLGLESNGNYTILFATIILTILPIVILFSMFSKTIMENTSVGGLKG